MRQTSGGVCRCSLRWIPSTLASASISVGQGASVFTGDLLAFHTAPCRFAAPLRHVAGFPDLGLLRGLRPISDSSVDDGPARHHPGRAAGRATPRWFPRSPCTGRRGRCPALLRQPRHGYAAGLPRGLPTGIRNRLRSRPPTGGGRALLTGPHPPGWSRRRDYGAFPAGSNCVYTFPSRLPDPGRLAVPTRPGVVGAAPTLTCVPRLRLPPASKACCDRPTMESFHLHPVHGASWRTRTPRPNDARRGPAERSDRHERACLCVFRRSSCSLSSVRKDSESR
jgi:hypothetical protein